MTTYNFNISLSHTNKILDINNDLDVGNIDRVLTQIVEHRNHPGKLKDLLENTSFKYLRRLQEDGLLANEGGTQMDPVSNPIIPKKTIQFESVGGYSSLLVKPSPRSINITHYETIIGDKIQDSSIKKFNKKVITTDGDSVPKARNKLLQWIIKWWWMVLVPFGIAIAVLAIEDKWFK
jgi:hypothetical protein